MPDITIPEAAVEAAAQVYFGEYGPSISWHSPSMSEGERDTWRDEVAAYLRAAAPHIAAQALRDAAAEAESHALSCPEGCDSLSCHENNRTTAAWLRDRANQIDADHG